MSPIRRRKRARAFAWQDVHTGESMVQSNGERVLSRVNVCASEKTRDVMTNDGKARGGSGVPGRLRRVAEDRT
jgi:hypothetical protein